MSLFTCPCFVGTIHMCNVLPWCHRLMPFHNKSLWLLLQDRPLRSTFCSMPASPSCIMFSSQYVHHAYVMHTPCITHHTSCITQVDNSQQGGSTKTSLPAASDLHRSSNSGTAASKIEEVRHFSTVLYNMKTSQ